MVTRIGSTITNTTRAARKLLAVGCLALGLGGAALFGSAGTAAADSLDASPRPPAVIDADGFQSYIVSSYPAVPTWPAPPTWASYPAPSSWPGDSSDSCCSR